MRRMESPFAKLEKTPEGLNWGRKSRVRPITVGLCAGYTMVKQTNKQKAMVAALRELRV